MFSEEMCDFECKGARNRSQVLTRVGLVLPPNSPYMFFCMYSNLFYPKTTCRGLSAPIRGCQVRQRRRSVHRTGPRPGHPPRRRRASLALFSTTIASSRFAAAAPPSLFSTTYPSYSYTAPTCTRIPLRHLTTRSRRVPRETAASCARVNNSSQWPERRDNALQQRM